MDWSRFAIESEGVEPTALDVATVIARAREQGVRVVFVQPQFPRRSAEIVAREIDGRVMVVDPMAPDWFENLREVSSIFAASLAEQGREG